MNARARPRLVGPTLPADSLSQNVYTTAVWELCVNTYALMSAPAGAHGHNGHQSLNLNSTSLAVSTGRVKVSRCILHVLPHWQLAASCATVCDEPCFTSTSSVCAHVTQKSEPQLLGTHGKASPSENCLEGKAVDVSAAQVFVHHSGRRRGVLSHPARPDTLPLHAPAHAKYVFSNSSARTCHAHKSSI